MMSVFLANAETWAGGAHLFFSFWLFQMITLSPAMLLSLGKIGFLPRRSGTGLEDSLVLFPSCLL